MDNIISKLTYGTKQRTTQTRHYHLTTRYAHQNRTSMEEYAERLASLIDTFVKSGEVMVQSGITLQAGAYTGATTSTGTGTIS